MRCDSAALKLFPEILIMIFEELVFDDTNIVTYPGPPPGAGWFWDLRNHHPCLPLSHVCQYWRQVALSCPHLWGILYANCSRRWFEFINKRAMNTLLILRKGVGVAPLTEEFGDPGLGRFKELHLESRTLSRYRSGWRVQDIIVGNAPMLEVLEVRGDPLWDLNLLLGIDIIMTMPRLRVLRLIGCTVDLSCLVSSTLQELFVDLQVDLQGVITPDSHSVSAANLLRSLSKLPSLRSLDLRYVLKSHDSDLEPPATDLITVQLPHLTHFFFAVVRWTHLLLIQHIIAPNLESLRLRCSPYLNATPVPYTALVPLCPRLPSVPPLQFSLDLNGESRCSVFQAFFSPSPTNSTTDTCHLTHFQIEFKSELSMLFEIPQSLPFGQPTVLSIASSTMPLREVILPLLTRVEEVYLGDINALNAIIPGMRWKVSAPMPYPALRHISLFIGDEGVSAYEGAFQALQTMLEQRKAGGAPNINLAVLGPPESDLDLHNMMSHHVNAFKYIPKGSEEYKKYPNFV